MTVELSIGVAGSVEVPRISSVSERPGAISYDRPYPISAQFRKCTKSIRSAVRPAAIDAR